MTLQAETFEHLQCKRLTLVNDAGEKVIDLASSHPSGGVITIFNADGYPVAHIGTEPSQKGVVIIGDENRKAVARIGCDAHGGNVRLAHKDLDESSPETAVVSLCTNETGGFMRICDTNANHAVILGNVDERGFLSITGRNDAPLALLIAREKGGVLIIGDKDGNPVALFPPGDE